MAVACGAAYGAAVAVGAQHLRGPWWRGRRARDLRADPERRELAAQVVGCYVIGACVLSSLAVGDLRYAVVAVAAALAAGWAATDLSRGARHRVASRPVLVGAFGGMWLATVAAPGFLEAAAHSAIVSVVAALWSAGAWGLIAELVWAAPPIARVAPPRARRPAARA